MLLAIDIGNTSTAIGVFNDGVLAANWRAETKKNTTADQMALLYREFFETAGLEFGMINGVAVSNVVPPVEHAVASMAKRYFNIEALFADWRNAGIKIKYPNPSEIGADRLANAVAAYEKFKSAVIVVDFGTATTFDYVDPEGAYVGGVIAPGVAIANEALYRWTSKLPRVEIAKRESVIAKSTVEAIQSGVYNGYIGLVKDILCKMKAEAGTSAKVVATGGLASLIAGGIGIEIERFLTLEGLRVIWTNFHKCARQGV